MSKSKVVSRKGSEIDLNDRSDSLSSGDGFGIN